MVINNIFSLGELFEQVQLQKIFPDSKTFVDCNPKLPLASIHERYELEKVKKDFNLTTFVFAHFDLPKDSASEYVSDTSLSVSQHIEILWDQLERKSDTKSGSLVPLPNPYIVPGGRFREVYYWDSYFTLLGLQISKRVELIQNMVNNFSHLIDQFGYIPNGNRTYFLGRSQPPFYACMITLLSEEKGSTVLIEYLPQLVKEHHFWMSGIEKLDALSPSEKRVVLLNDENILNHYWDENDTPRPEAFKEDIALAQNAKDKKIKYRHLRAAAESGWDFSSRWFKNKNDFSSIHTTEIIPVDLNCLLWNLEKTIAEAYHLLNRNEDSLKYETAAEKRKASINKFCWSDEQEFYFDYDYVAGEQKESWTLAATFPLFFKIASKKQADGIAKKLEQKFLFPGGLISTTENTGQQWDAPNGWAPLQWIAIQGLAKYGYHELAKNITKRWMNINEKVYFSSGKMMEKYNVVDTDIDAGGGEYPAQDGFGWTNGVYLALDKWMKE